MTLPEDLTAAPDHAVERAPTVAATPALFAGAALVAAFFMPLVSAFGGLFTFSPWSYLRLAFDGGSELSAMDWVIVALMPVAAILGAAVVVTEARGQRIRALVGAAAAIPIGLLIYIAIDIGSLEDFRYADMAGYTATAAALVLLATVVGGLDTNRQLRRVVFGACGLLVVAGILVPATGNSAEDSFNEMFEGFASDLSDGADDTVDGFTNTDKSINPFTLGVAVMEALEEDHDIDAVVDCSDEIQREVGANTTCTFETLDSDDEYDVDVTISGIDGDDVELDVVPATDPN